MTEPLPKPMQASEEEISRRWRPALMAFFLRRVRDHAEAEDLTHEGFVRMFNSVEGSTASDAYVFQIAANLLADRARRSKVRASYRDAIAASSCESDGTLDPHQIAVGRARLAAFAAALEQLPERQRAMFTLYRIENMSQDRIAEAFGISTSAVKKQIAKAMAFVMVRMREKA